MEEIVFDVVYMVFETEPHDASEIGAISALGLTDTGYLAESAGDETSIVF